MALDALLFCLLAGAAALGVAGEQPAAGSGGARACSSERATELPLIDTHLHYSLIDAAQLPPAEVIALFDQERVQAAVVSGRADAAVEALHRAAPERILPFLSVYETPAAKRDWMHDAELPGRVEQWLASGIYRGIGELHLFAGDRDSRVLAELVDLAQAQDLMLQVHGDAAVVDAVFARAPELTVLWAHLGTDPRPEAVGPMLARYPRLYADTSVRDERFVDTDGCLRPEWRDFFIAYADQVLVGVDTQQSAPAADSPAIPVDVGQHRCADSVAGVRMAGRAAEVRGPGAITAKFSALCVRREPLPRGTLVISRALPLRAQS